MKKIKVIIVDDSKLVRRGIRYTLELDESIEIIGEAAHCDELFELLKKGLPDILLMDIEMPKMNGIDLTRKVKEQYKDVKALIITHEPTVKHIVDSIRAGARGFLLKDTSDDELLSAIHNIYKGNSIMLGETIPQEIIDNSLTGKPVTKNFKLYNLGDKETEIIFNLAKGLSSKEIAEILHISPNTVESHKNNIKEKLGLKTVIEYVIFALKNRIISLDEL